MAGKRSGSGITNKQSASNIFDEKSFNDKLETYVSGGYNLDSLLNDADKNYIIEHSTQYSGPLYRVEDTRYTAKLLDDGKLKNNNFEFDGNLRSFSRKEAVIKEMLNENSDDYAGIYNPVIFKVLGGAKQYNMAPHTTHYMTDQAESLVGGKFRKTGESYVKMNGENVRMITIRQIEEPMKRKRK